MPITFTGTKIPQSQIEEIQSEIYSDWGTFRDRDVNIQEGHKSGAEVYESKITVASKAYTGDAVTAGSGVAKVDRSVVNLTKIEYSDLIDYNVLLNTRFEKSMKKGAFETVSQEFDNAILQYITPAISQSMENITWNGATTATKVAIAALTPGAGQGSISAGAQTLVAAMPVNLIDSLSTVILYNASQSKAVPGAGLGDYVKVGASAYTAATIAAEYAKMFAGIDPKVMADVVNPPVIFAPLADRALMLTANNSVGAASNKNFVFQNESLTSKCFYNGVEVKFKPLVTFHIISPSAYLVILFDMMNDMNILETGKQANGSDKYFYKNVQAFATWCTNQRYITLYGG
jgi:hypothetical protein